MTLHVILFILAFSEFTQNVYFHENELAFEKINTGRVFRQTDLQGGISHLPVRQAGSYDIVRIEGYTYTNIIGEPQLPVKSIYLLLPEGTKVAPDGLTVTPKGFKWLSGEYTIWPSQPPQILSKPVSDSIVYNSSVYELSSEYPGKLAEYKGEIWIGKQRCALITIYPVQYVPKSKEVKLYTTIEVRVRLEASDSRRLLGLEDLTPHQQQQIKKFIAPLVINPEYLRKQSSKDQKLGYEYVIITPDSLKDTFELLANWKTLKGVPAVVRTTEWIEGSYDGRDLAEKIRNFLKVAYRDSGLIWVLLGGNVDQVPTRYAYAMTCGAGIMWNEDDIPADMYYSDLDGSWDANENNVFGEVDDEVDLYPDVFVGRAPVTTVDIAQAFVDKVLTYEKNPSSNCLADALFFAEILWKPPGEPYTDSGIAKDMIEEFFPAAFNILKLYESQGTESASSVRNAMNAGKGLLNHNGHGWIYVMSAGIGDIYNNDFNYLTNGDKQGILYSIGCWCGAIDYSDICIGEHWVRTPNKAGIAFIGNSRYGWGSPGNPGYGYSDVFDKQFYYELFQDDVTKLGQTLTASKAPFIAVSREANVYRTHQYQLNLLGDPEIDIWTAAPESLEVIFPESLSVGESLFRVFVKNGGEPLSGALVCCMKGDEVYESCYTNEAGEAKLAISPTTPGSLFVTVTVHNFYPYQGGASVFSSGPCPRYYDHSTSDLDGNGEMNPGDTIVLMIKLKNYGLQSANDVIATLRTEDYFVTVFDSMGDFGTIAPGDTSSADFAFQISPLPSNGHILQFKLEMEGFGISLLNLTVAAPLLTCQDYAVDSIPNPGDTFNLYIGVKNTGLGEASSAKGRLSSGDAYITVIDSLADLGYIFPDSSAICTFKLSVNESCPVPYFPELILASSVDSNFLKDSSFVDTFILAIGQGDVSLFENFEDGDSGWTYGGSPDTLGWALTQHGAHSGSYSWYCGDTVEWCYQNNMNCWLVSPELVLGPDSWLSFWYWCETATYGVDGIYVLVREGTYPACPAPTSEAGRSRQTGWDTLDFIGSGGNLDSLYFGNDWVKKGYDLSFYEVGCTLQIGFSFVSDGEDIAEGFYIDDVRVGKLENDGEVHKLGFTIDESNGNNNGIPEPGETVDLTISFINDRLSICRDAYAKLRTNDLYINILSDSVYFGDIQGREIVKGIYSFVSGSTTPEGRYAKFTIDIYGDGYQNTAEFSIKIGLVSGEVIYQFPTPFPHGGLYGLAYDGNGLWCSSWYDDTLHRLDPVTGEVQHSILAPVDTENVDITYGSNYLWVQNQHTKIIYKLSPGDGAIIDSFNSPARDYPTGLCFDGYNLWVADSSSQYIYKLTTGGTLVDSFKPITAPCRLQGLAFDPRGPGGGSLLQVVSYYNSWGYFDSTVIYEIDRQSLEVIPGHSFKGPAMEAHVIEVDPATGDYWIGVFSGIVYKVRGLHSGEHQDTIPLFYRFAQNCSNPFSPEGGVDIKYKYELPDQCKVSLKIYDRIGRLVSSLVNEWQEPGVYEKTWDARKDGKKVPSGIYFCRLNAGSYTSTKKLVIIK